MVKKEKISSWIETDYQDGFLEDIFENCLGYISKARSVDEHYTLEREKKNETNTQKADGMLFSHSILSRGGMRKIYYEKICYKSGDSLSGVNGLLG